MTEKVLNVIGSVITKFPKAFSLQPIHLYNHIKYSQKLGQGQGAGDRHSFATVSYRGIIVLSPNQGPGGALFWKLPK